MNHKYHRPNPLVEMELFIASRGLPISMHLASGSDSEMELAISTGEKITVMFKGKKFIYCADAGLNSTDIRKFNSMGGRIFAVTQSFQRDKELRKRLKFAISELFLSHNC